MSASVIEGSVRDFAGKVQDTVGSVTGDGMTQLRGKLNQAAGQVQQGYGAAVDEARDFTTARPLTAVFAAVGIGFLLGLAVAAAPRR